MGDPKRMTEDEEAKIQEWVNDWAGKYLALSEFPESWQLSEKGTHVLITMYEDDGDPVISTDGFYVGLTTHEIAVGEDVASRVDVVLHDGKAIPIERRMKVTVDGQVVIEPELG